MQKIFFKQLLRSETRHPNHHCGHLGFRNPARLPSWGRCGQAQRRISGRRQGYTENMQIGVNDIIVIILIMSM